MLKKYLFLFQSNISILKNTNPDESLCNCHEVNNDQDLVINPYINYSSLSHRRNQGNNFHQSRQEPIYQNQQEIFQENCTAAQNPTFNKNSNYPIYSVVNKRNNKNVRINLEQHPDNKSEAETNTETEQETEEEMDDNEDQRCLTPSNTYLELSFEQSKPENIGTTPKATNNFFKDFVHHSTPNNGMYFEFITEKT